MGYYNFRATILWCDARSLTCPHETTLSLVVSRGQVSKCCSKFKFGGTTTVVCRGPPWSPVVFHGHVRECSSKAKSASPRTVISRGFSRFPERACGQWVECVIQTQNKVARGLWLLPSSGYQIWVWKSIRSLVHVRPR